MKRFASLFFCIFAMTLSAQTPLTADGVAAFTPTAASGGGGGCTASYSNTGGTGNRTAIIAVTTTGGMPTGGAPLSAWVNGDTTSNGQFFFGGGAIGSSQSIVFDFGSGNAVLITEAKYYQQDATSQGTWKWQGSADNSSWTDIGGNFSLATAATTTLTTLSGNSTSYRYYRILGVSGSCSAGPWCYEMEFKICGL